MSTAKNASVNQTIENALKKIGSKNESEICRYLPGPNGGYMHHFTFRKMKREEPKEIVDLMNKHIVNAKSPSRVNHKPRAARGSRKRKDQIVFTRQDIDNLLRMARLSGNKDMVRKLTPKQDLKTIKRELINSIKSDRVESDLWESYVEVTSSQKMLAEA